MENLFVYGTLRENDVQKRIFGRSVSGVNDILENYNKSNIIINGNTYPIAAPKSGSNINGIVISVTPKELKLIDDYETNAYRRARAALRSGLSAWVYQM